MRLSPHILFPVLLLSAATAFPQEPEFFQGVDFYTSVKSSARKGTDSPALDTVAGMKLRTKNLTGIAAFRTTDSLLPIPDENSRYGVKIHAEFPGFPYRADLYAGTLRYGKGLTRLKNPTLPSGTALRKPSLPVAGIAPSLPAFTSALTPVSAAFRFTPFPQAAGLPIIQYELCSDGTKAASVIEKLSFSGTGAAETTLSLACTGALFRYGQHATGRTWKLKEPFYPEKQYASADIELCMDAGGIFKGSAIIGASENPFGGMQDAYFWFQTQDSVRLKGFTLNGAWFHACSPSMILPAGKKLSFREQFQLNPQLTFALPAGTLRTGMLFQKNTVIATSRTPEHEQYSMNAATSFSRGRNRISLSYAQTSVPLTQKTSHNAKLSLRHKADSCTLTAAAGLSFTDVRQTLTFSQKIAPAHSLFSSINIENSLYFRDGQYDGGKISGGLTFNFTSRKTNWSGRISVADSF